MRSAAANCCSVTPYADMLALGLSGESSDTAVELAATTTKADFLEAELARLGAEADDLRDQLRAERRTWWQRLTNGGR